MTMNDLPRNIRCSQRFALARRPLALAMALAVSNASRALAIDPAAPAPDPEPFAPQAAFNAGFLHTAGEALDLSRFERGNVTLAGIYRPTVLVNGEPVPGTHEIVFRQVEDSASAQPCFNRASLIGMGVDMEKVATPGDDLACGHIERVIPGATIDFDDGEQVLRISIPNAYVASRARGYVSPEFWDEGESAAMLNYNANAYRVRSEGRSATSTYIGANAGANLGAWRLRQSGSLSVHDGKSRWQNNQVFVQRDLTDARAQLTIGETYTSGEILDSVRIRGASIVSDQRMLPTSQRGYAPVIRGVAESNAQVTIRQNGYVIHSTTVAPGAFEIDDLYPTGYGSDLEVVVTEADGRTKTTLVPYTAVPQMLREGASRFAISAGQVDEAAIPDTPFVFQATTQYGVSNHVTLYGGTTVSNSYGSGLVGTAVNLPIGAVALDVTGSRAALRRDGIRRGVSTRLRYSRSLSSIGTNLGIAAYRFSTREYLGVTDAARLRSRLKRGLSGARTGGERSRFDVNVGQRIGSGQLALTGSLVDYWEARSRSLDYTLGYSNSWRALTYNVSVQRSRIGNAFGQIGGTRHPDVTDTTFFVAVSVPLGRTASSPRLGTTYNRGSDDNSSLQATLNGPVGTNEDLTYNLAAARSDTGGADARTSGSASLAYRSFAGTYRASAGRASGGASQYSLGATGAIVAHANGITFAQELGETNAILHAPGAAGARVENRAGVRLDRHGNAVVRGVLPYQFNTIAIDPLGASHDVQLESTSETVAPRAGAFARFAYRTSVAQALLIQATQPGGEPLPFGASVLDHTGQPVGVVGQGSKIFARGDLAGARLTVRWGEGGAKSCRIALPAALDHLGMHGLHRAVKAACIEGDGATPIAQKAA
jgi:outer membrane usher protein